MNSDILVMIVRFVIPVSMALTGACVVLLLGRRRRTLANASPMPSTDGLQIPVNAIFTRSGQLFGSKQHNSINPELTIGRAGIGFRALTRKQWPIAQIAHVEIRPRRGGWKLIFVGRGQTGVVVADIVGEANVLAALRALPDGTVMTPQAALLRDGTPAAGTDNLTLYRGLLR